MNPIKVKKFCIQNISKDSPEIFNLITEIVYKTLELFPNNFSEKEINFVIDYVRQSLDYEEASDLNNIQEQIKEKLATSEFDAMAKRNVLRHSKSSGMQDAYKNLLYAYQDVLFTDSINNDLKRENANINTDASMGIMLKLGAESAKYFVDNYVLPEKFVEADKENWIHIHDKDFSLITFNCCQIDLLKLFHGGFSTGHGFLREPSSVRSYASLACIAIQSNQNDMFGGQSINAFDYAMAEGIRKSFKKALKNEVERASIFCEVQFSGKVDFEICTYSEKENPIAINNLARVIGSTKLAKKIYKQACADVEEETHQAMEALIHNFNTLHSRAGAQVPFSSINYGMDTSSEGRLATREVLNAIEAGLGNGETPIFPISVFQLKSGVNYNSNDPNYDLFRQACKVSAKRLFPNFLNLDAPYNLKYYRAGDYNSYVATMGCRTRVMSNVNGREESGGRGNFSFVTINLPKIALESNGDLKIFFEIYDKYITLSHDYLLFRLKMIEEKCVYNFPFLMGQGIWMDSEKLEVKDKIKDIIKHASYSIGFCGLAECLVALIGEHHGQSDIAQELGLKIVKHLRKRTDEYTKLEKRNWTTFGSPAESTAGQFQSSNLKVYGKIKGVTDREYMTNSSHIPVYFPICAAEKIRIEAPYHKLCNAGHISYIEIDADPTQNLLAFETLIRAMHDANMGYFAVNHPVDRDPVCGYTGIITNECPHCHRKEFGTGTFHTRRLRFK